MIRRISPFLALASAISLCSCSWNNRTEEMTISDTPGSLESDFTHNSRPIKIEFDRNMLIAMNLPVHVARQRIRESMPVNASLPMEEWTIDHWKERVRVTSFADVSYVDEDTTISTEGVEPHSVTYEQLAE